MPVLCFGELAVCFGASHSVFKRTAQHSWRVPVADLDDTRCGFGGYPWRILGILVMGLEGIRSVFKGVRSVFSSGFGGYPHCV